MSGIGDHDVRELLETASKLLQRTRRLREERAELLTALKLAEALLRGDIRSSSVREFEDHERQIRAAIAKAEAP